LNLPKGAEDYLQKHPTGKNNDQQIKQTANAKTKEK